MGLAIRDRWEASPARQSRAFADVTTQYLARETAFAPHSDAILSLWAAHLHDVTPESGVYKIRHWYEENPAGSGACVVLQAAGQESPVGVQCLLERRHWSGGDTMKVAGLAEFAIDPAHRTLGPALSLLKKCLEVGRNRYGMVYGLPNDSAFSVCKRAGMVHAGDMTRFVLPLRLRLLVRRRGSRWLHWLEGPVDLLLRISNTVRAAWNRAPRRWRETSLDDPDVGTIWELRPQYLSLSERSIQALDWRFNLGTGWKLAVAYGPSRFPFGYVVWRVKDDIVQIGDFLCPDADEKTAALLSGFARLIRSKTDANGVELEFCGRPSVVRGIRHAGFMRRSVMCPLVFDRRPGDGAETTSRLYFTTFDRVSD